MSKVWLILVAMVICTLAADASGSCSYDGYSNLYLMARPDNRPYYALISEGSEGWRLYFNICNYITKPSYCFVGYPDASSVFIVEAFSFICYQVGNLNSLTIGPYPTAGVEGVTVSYSGQYVGRPSNVTIEIQCDKSAGRGKVDSARNPESCCQFTVISMRSAYACRTTT